MQECKYIKTVGSGHVFRDWLVEVLGDRLQNKKCEVRIFKIGHASHRICRYKFKGEGISVVGKFYSQPTGMIKESDSYKLMRNEYNNLRKVEGIIDIARPVDVNKNFNCALLTEYVPGKPLSWYLKHDVKLRKRLKSTALMLRKLHQNTQNSYDKKGEFAKFHYVLKHLKISRNKRKKYEHLLGKWWQSSLLDQEHGCLIHNDATPANYIFHRGRPFAIDFELSSRHGNSVCDLGIMCAELKHYFARRGIDSKAEPYIRHFLRSYSKNKEEFNKITEILPFYMGYGFLRISILKWNQNYKRYLLKEAENCLKSINRAS